MLRQHLLHNYIKLTDAELGNSALHVSAQVDGNANFTTSPVTPAALNTAATGFLAAMAVCQDGTKQDTLHKNALRDALISQLDELAAYVEITAKNNAEVMVSSGFNLTSTTAVKPAPVGAVSITAVSNAAGGSLNLAMDYGPNVWAFETQVSTAPNVWVAAGYFTHPRNVTLTNLTPGTLYNIRVRVHGSRNQVSDWSDPVSHMAM
jgi:hypothetical protein